MAPIWSCNSYDASYVWLAASLGADLVTLDTRLARAVDALTTPA
jgi:predicted nucleic acid-binding protein